MATAVPPLQQAAMSKSSHQPLELPQIKPGRKILYSLKGSGIGNIQRRNVHIKGVSPGYTTGKKHTADHEQGNGQPGSLLSHGTGTKPTNCFSHDVCGTRIAAGAIVRSFPQKM